MPCAVPFRLLLPCARNSALVHDLVCVTIPSPLTFFHSYINPFLPLSPDFLFLPCPPLLYPIHPVPTPSPLPISLVPCPSTSLSYLPSTRTTVTNLPFSSLRSPVSLFRPTHSLTRFNFFFHPILSPRLTSLVPFLCLFATLSAP